MTTEGEMEGEMEGEPANTVLARANRLQREAASPDRSAWVAASAGSGKTKVLTDRVLNLLFAGTTPQAILCLTYTNAAAAEMAIRINHELAEWATASDAKLDEDLAALVGRDVGDEGRRAARRLFAAVLDVPGGMKIMTIHAFCQSVLRRFPIEAGVAPHFELMSEHDSAEALENATTEVLGIKHSENDELARAIEHVTARVSQQTFAELLASLRDSRTQIGALIARHGGLGQLIAHTREVLGVGVHESGDSILADFCSDETFDARGLARAARALAQGNEKTDRPKAPLIERWLDDPASRNDQFGLYKRAFLTQKDEPLARLHTKQAVAALEELPDIMTAEQTRVFETVDRIKSVGIAEATAALLTLGTEIVETYQRHKNALALKDFDDLILDTHRLVTGADAAPWVLYKLDGGIEHILIDEAQDTSAVQWDLVRTLAEEFFAGYGTHDESPAPARTVFAVGDTKQSIYSFQHAEPKLFRENQAHFAARTSAAERRWSNVELDISFRSNQAVLRAVDAVFATASAGDGVREPGRRLHHLAKRADAGGCVELWPLVAPRDQDSARPWKPPVEEVAGDNPRNRLGLLLADRIKSWLDDEELLESQGRPIRPDDIMILVRRRDSLVTDIVRALKKRDVPVSGVDRMVLTEALAIRDLTACAQFLLLPEDDLTLATVLKSPLIGFDEEELFDLAHARTGTLWQELAERAHTSDSFRTARASLEDLLARVDYEPPYEFFARLLARGGKAKILARLGAEAEDPLNEFLALALDYERGGASSMQGFLHWLDAGAAEIKRDLDRAAGMVRVMTVHGAKGLQSPIVILPDTCGVPRQRGTLYWLGQQGAALWAPRAEDRDRLCSQAAEAARREMTREHNRLLYVAMTRAQDRLYICGWRGVNKPPQECWYELIAQALEGAGRKTQDPFLAEHAADIGATVLRLTCEQTGPVETGDEGRAAVKAQELPAWARQPAPAEPIGPRPYAPSKGLIDTSAALSPLDRGQEDRGQNGAQDSRRNGPGDADRFRRGRLIHALLQRLPELEPAARAAAGSRTLAAMAGDIGQAGRDEILQEVLAILTDPALEPLFGPDSQAEVPVTGMVRLAATPESLPLIVSGQIDRLVVTADRIRVIDFKTNRPPPRTVDAVPPIYIEQMAAYAALLAEIYPGRVIDCALLWTVGPRIMALDSAALERAASALSPGLQV